MSDLDPLLREAMASVKRPIDARPSISDVHRRARRHNRRRMAATAGAVACTGVAAAALVIRRDATDLTTSSQPESAEQAVAEEIPPTTYMLLGTTTSVYGLSEMTVRSSTVWDALWNARFDPSGAALAIEPADQAAADVMPTPEQFGCTSDECRMMFTYVVWHEIARTLGFGDVRHMQEMNPAIDFSQPPREGDVVQTAYSSFSEPPQTTIYAPAPGTSTSPTTTYLVSDDPPIFTTTTSVGQIGTTTTPG